MRHMCPRTNRAARSIGGPHPTGGDSEWANPGLRHKSDPDVTSLSTIHRCETRGVRRPAGAVIEDPYAGCLTGAASDAEAVQLDHVPLSGRAVGGHAMPIVVNRASRWCGMRLRRRGEGGAQCRRDRQYSCRDPPSVVHHGPSSRLWCQRGNRCDTDACYPLGQPSIYICATRSPVVTAHASQSGSPTITALSPCVGRTTPPVTAWDNRSTASAE